MVKLKDDERESAEVKMHEEILAKANLQQGHHYGLLYSFLMARTSSRVRNQCLQDGFIHFRNSAMHSIKLPRNCLGAFLTKIPSLICNKTSLSLSDCSICGRNKVHPVLLACD